MRRFAQTSARRVLGASSTKAQLPHSTFLPSRPIACNNTSSASDRQSQPSQLHTRSFQTSATRRNEQKVPNEQPPTDFSNLDVLGNTPAPSTSVDVCMYDGFGLNSGIRIGEGNGALLVNGEAFEWRPWEATGKMELVNAKGQFDLPPEAFSVFDVLWPRPDMLVIGVGKLNIPLSPRTRKRVTDLGMRLEAMDTRNAASQFNLLATERGVSEVAGALIPIGWKEGEGAK